MDYNPTIGNLRPIQEDDEGAPVEGLVWYPQLFPPDGFVGFDAGADAEDWETYQPEDTAGYVWLQPDPAPTVYKETDGDPKFCHGLDFVQEEYDKDDVPTWSESDRMRNITKTSAFVAATPTTTTNDYTLNVQGIVDEIIQRTGWSSGHDMRFAAFDQLASGTQVALVAALEHATNTAARLDIEYTVVAGGGIMFPF